MEGNFYPQNLFWTPEMEMALDAEIGAMNAGFSTLPFVPDINYQERVMGIDPMVQNFYEGPKKCDCCPNWVEKPPTQMPEASKERYDHASVRIYKRKDHASGSAMIGGLWTTTDDTVEIQSRFTIDLIRPILAEVGRLAPEKDKIKFEAPFRDLYFAHPKIMQLAQKYADGSEEQKHLNVLVDVMTGLFSTMTAEVSRLLSRKSISFKYIWTLYPKGMIVYAKLDEKDRLYQVQEVVYHAPTLELKGTNLASKAYWRINCIYFSFDGQNFGTCPKTFTIYNFDEVRRIKTLWAYPVGYHHDPKLEQKMIERGRKLLDFQAASHCEHNGVASAAYYASDEDEFGHRDRQHISGRVVVDAFGLWKFNDSYHEWNMPLEDETYEDQDENRNLCATRELSKKPGRTLPRIEGEHRRPTIKEQDMNRASLEENDQYLRIMSPEISGYSLVTNKWYHFDVDNFRPISWALDAFDSLVFPENDKNLLLTFVERHEQSSEEDDDFIPGKGMQIDIVTLNASTLTPQPTGQGLAILFSGPPGTGKTLTAEAISERLQRPLYRLQAENLGSSAKAIGANLREAFELTLYWKAIILLDEADSLLSRRTLNNAAHNEVIAVVLRQLEYYQGVIFMTTNLMDNIDAAFRSRIRLHLCYQPLSTQHRLELWKKFIERLGMPSTRMALSAQDWQEVARWDLNGREIKNAAKNLTLWCHYNAYLITLEHVDSAIRVTAPFAKKGLEAAEEEMDVQSSRKRPRLLL